MKRAILLAVIVTYAFPGLLHAQARRYRVMAGVGVNSVNPFDSDLGTDLGPGIIVRGVPRKGFGPVFDLSLASIDVKRSSERRTLGELRVRAVLGGIGYTIEKGRFATTFHSALGYALNKAETGQQLVDRGAQFDVQDGPLFRSGVTLTFSASRRWVLVSSLGALFLNPDITLKTTDAPGQPAGSEGGTWPAHALLWQVGVAFKVF